MGKKNECFELLSQEQHLKKKTFQNEDLLTAWASAGEGKRGHLPPPPLADQNSMFFNFFERK